MKKESKHLPRPRGTAGNFQEYPESLAAMAPGSNAEFMARMPDFDPEKRKAPLDLWVSRRRRIHNESIAHKGDMSFQFKLDANGSRITFDSRSAMLCVGVQFLEMACAIFRPDRIIFDHKKGRIDDMIDACKGTPCRAIPHQIVE